MPEVPNEKPLPPLDPHDGFQITQARMQAEIDTFEVSEFYTSNFPYKDLPTRHTVISGWGKLYHGMIKLSGGTYSSDELNIRISDRKADRAWDEGQLYSLGNLNAHQRYIFDLRKERLDETPPTASLCFFQDRFHLEINVTTEFMDRIIRQVDRNHRSSLKSTIGIVVYWECALGGIEIWSLAKIAGLSVPPDQWDNLWGYVSSCSIVYPGHG